MQVRGQGQHCQDAGGHEGNDDGGGPAHQPALTAFSQGQHQQRRPDQVELFLHCQGPQGPDGHADIEGQREVLEVAEPGQQCVSDDSLGPVAEDVCHEFDAGIDAQESDEGREEPEGPVGVEPAVAHLAVPFDIADQHAGDQVPAEDEKGYDAGDARALEQSRPGVAQEDAADGGAAENVQAFQPSPHRAVGCSRVHGPASE